MNVKLQSTLALMTYLKTQLLGGSMGVLTTKMIYAEEEEEVKTPALGIVPGIFSFESCQEEERDDQLTDQLLVEIGELQGSVELRVYGKNAPERETWGQRVMNAFGQTELAPGLVTVLTPPVVVVLADGSEVTTTHRALAAFELAGEQWQDEMVFAKKRYSFTNVDATIPVFALRTQVPMIDMLYSSIAFDLSATAPDSQVAILDASQLQDMITG